MRAHHEGIPLMISEFGVPSSRAMAHRGPLERNQGFYTEEEQGEVDAELLESIHSEDYDGGILFAWQDEWFKTTWNTTDLETPSKRRIKWRNRLTPKENFGVIAVEPGECVEETILLDGETEDWERREVESSREYPDFDLSVTHDEANLYLLARKKEACGTSPKKSSTSGSARYRAAAARRIRLRA